MRASLFAAAVALGLVVSACGSVTAAEEVRSSVARSAASTDPSAARASLDAFAVDLYRELAKQPGNLVLSPYSVAVALAMTRAGAVGETAAQMDRVLHAQLAGDLDGAYNTLEQTLAKRSGTFKIGDQTFELELATANRLWGQKGTTFEQPFLDRLAASYGAGMQIVDYRTATESARKTINAWVASRTHDRITDLIPQGVLDDMTRLVLTNAIYLKAAWLYKLEDAKPGTFTRADGSTIQADLMHLHEDLLFAKGSGYRAVSLPYAGGLSMIALLPDGDLASFETSLDATTLRGIVGALRDTQTDVWLPKFSYRTEAGLKDALTALGMPIAFDDIEADFSGMTKEEHLYISAVLHQAFIAVDEKGTEAAAATAVVARASAAPVDRAELRLDRPFLYLIQDMATGAVLFMGRVSDPTAR